MVSLVILWRPITKKLKLKSIIIANVAKSLNDENAKINDFDDIGGFSWSVWSLQENIKPKKVIPSIMSKNPKPTIDCQLDSIFICVQKEELLFLSFKNEIVHAVLIYDSICLSCFKCIELWWKLSRRLRFMSVWNGKIVCWYQGVVLKVSLEPAKLRMYHDAREWR